MSNQTKKNNREADVALITGSRRGIGLGIAVELAKEGFSIVMNGTARIEIPRIRSGRFSRPALTVITFRRIFRLQQNARR